MLCREEHEKKRKKEETFSKTLNESIKEKKWEYETTRFQAHD